MGYGAFVLKKQIKFIVVTTAYNVSDWILRNIDSINNQTYNNYIHIIVDDNSTDDTLSIIRNNINDKLVILCNDDNGSQCKSFLYAWDWLKYNDFDNESVIVEVDGDDWLYSNDTLEYLNGIYNSDDSIWMTSGQYILYPDNIVGGHYNAWSEWVNRYVDDNNLYRQYPFPYSHLKTYKFGLLNKVLKSDIYNYNTDNYFDCIFDHVLCIPMVEMSGRDRIFVSDKILYTLNRSKNLGNEGSINTIKQKQTEVMVREQVKRYSRL